jgi:hypothetical protein
MCEGSQVSRFSVSVIAKGRGSVAITPNKSMVDSGQTITITAMLMQTTALLTGREQRRHSELVNNCSYGKPQYYCSVSPTMDQLSVLNLSVTEHFQRI